MQAEGDQAGIEVHQEAGTQRLSDLVNKGAVFDICFNASARPGCHRPRVGSGFQAVLAQLPRGIARTGHQALHADWREPITADRRRPLPDAVACTGNRRLPPRAVARASAGADQFANQLLKRLKPLIVGRNPLDIGGRCLVGCHGQSRQPAHSSPRGDVPRDERNNVAELRCGNP
jgi:hypothetical protein